MAIKTALVLSGGGAKGAFQVAVERYAREELGFQWDVIAGVSVGALNAAMLGMEKYQRLWEIWTSLTRGRFFRGSVNPISVARALLGAPSMLSNGPLWELIQAEFEPEKVTKDIRVGAVSLTTGEYVRFSGKDPDMARAILASTAMPMLWTPMSVSDELPLMVDGAVRNVSPLHDVLDVQPDRIVVINCSNPSIVPLSKQPRTAFRIASRTLEIMFNEIFRQDISTYMAQNALIRQAAEHGIQLQIEGVVQKPAELIVVEPTIAMSSSLDFSMRAVQRSLRHGFERAQEVLGGSRRLDDIQ